MRTLNLEKIQTTKVRTSNNQSLSQKTSKLTLMDLKDAEKVAKNDREAQTSDQKERQATIEQTYANSTALSS